MRNIIVLLLAGIVLSIGFFCLFHWVLNFSFKDAMAQGIIIALSAIFVELIKPYFKVFQSKELREKPADKQQ